MRSEIVSPTYATWDLVPCNASLRQGDILPDGSTILFGTRTVTATTGNVTASWSVYSISTDDPEFPTTAKDMSNMAKYEKNDTLYGTQAQKNKWYRKYKEDLNKAPSNPDSVKKVYIDTFKYPK